MTKLISALCDAHRELLLAIDQGGDQKALGSTARKVEATLLASLTEADEKARAALVGAVMNSGSLKALKTVPENARPSPYAFHEAQPKAEFIAAQPSAYMREAQKRGFVISDKMRLSLLTQVAEASSAHARMRPEALLLQGQISDYMMMAMIAKILDMAPEGAARVAPAAAKLFRACHKARPEASEQVLAEMFCIHDPAAADASLFRVIALYALLGTKMPLRDTIEHDDMRRLAKLLFSSQGRKDLKALTGGLEAYIASGLGSASPLLAEFEAKRKHFRPPTSSRRAYA